MLLREGVGVTKQDVPIPDGFAGFLGGSLLCDG